MTWTERAACADYPTDWWHPKLNIGPRTHDPYGQGRTVCDECPVAGDCAEHAITEYEMHGLWGGMDPEERSAERDRRGMLWQDHRWSTPDHGTEAALRRHYRQDETPCAACREAGNKQQRRRWEAI